MFKPMSSTRQLAIFACAWLAIIVYALTTI